MANLSWISSNPDYINQMIRNTQVTLSNNYNDLDNIPIIKITSTTNNPQKIWGLKEGLYMIDGVVQVDNNTSYEVSNLLISMTARLENGKYILSAFIPYLRGLFEYILRTNSTEYEQHQKIVLMIKNDTLALDNETIYTPIEDYHPATKKYVDDKANEIIAELDRMGVNKENLESLNKENRIRDIKLQALLSETSDRNITIEENVRYFDMPLSIDNGIVTINEIVGETLVNVCDQEESVAITKSYTVENENHIPLQGEYDGSCRPVVYGNTLVNHNADWDNSLQTGVETSASGIEDVVVEGIKGQEVSVVVEGNTVLNHALGKTSAVVDSVEDNLITKLLSTRSKNIIFSNGYIERLNDQTDTAWSFDTSLFKPNTIYTVYYDIIINTLDCNVTLINNTYMGRKIIQTGFIGSESYTFTSPDTISSPVEGWVDNINAVGDFKFSIKIYEGDHTTNPKYVNSNEGNYVDLTVANDMSSVVEIEGRTMVNVCDQKEPIAITKNYTIENSGNHIALQGEYDGKCRPVIQGNTIVNLAPKYTINWTHDGTWQSLFLMGTQANATVKILQDLKPATTYTIIVNITKNTQSGYTLLNNYHEGTSVFLTHMRIDPEDLGIKTFVVTTRDSFDTLDPTTAVILRSQSSGIASGETVIEDIMIFEGDLTQTQELIPTEYVEGLKSSFEDGYIPENVINIDNVYVYGISNDTALYNKYHLERVLQAGKTYTLSYNIDDTTTCENGVIFRLTYNNNSSTYINIDEGNLKGRIGKKVRTFTIPDDFDNSLLSKFEFWNRYSDTIISVSNISILEGDWTHLTEEDFNNLGKYKVEYKVTGKNKCYNHVHNSTSLNIYHKGLKLGHYRISIETPTLFNINTVYAKGNTILGYISSDGQGNARATIDITEENIDAVNSDYGYIWVYRGNGDISDITNIQLEEGTVATEYEPYKEYTKTFYLNSPLLEGDTIEDINGVATHVKRYGKVVLDGSESWVSGKSVNNEPFACLHYPRMKKDVVNTEVLIISDTLPAYSSNTLWGLKSTSGISTAVEASYFRIKLAKETTIDTIVGEVKQWLSENPTTVVYELASPIYESISTESILCDSYVNGHLDFDSAVPIGKVVFKNIDFYNKYIKPSTVYNIQFESDNNGMFNMIGLSGVKIFAQEVTKGINKINITTPTTVNHTALETDGIGFNASNIVVTEAVDKEFDYFEGLKSSYEYEVTEDGKYKVDVKVTGKNLFDGVLPEKIDTWSLSCYIKKGTYRFSANLSGFNNGTRLVIAFMDKDDKVITNTRIGYNTILDRDCYKMHFYSNDYSYAQSVNNFVNISNLQLEEGTKATSYEPYFESAKTFYLNSPLLEGDKIVTKNGKVYHYHKMGKVVLDGSEVWTLDINKATTSAYYTPSGNGKGASGTLYANILCDELVSECGYNLYNSDIEGIAINGRNEFNISLNKSKLTNGIAKYLQANPITVVYELLNPYYELIDEYNNTILNIPKNVAHLTHTSAVPVNNTTFTNYKDELNVLEANTQYRLMFDCDKANIPFTVTLGGTSQEVTSKKGTHSILITTPSELVDKNLVIDGIGRCGIDNIRIFKGNVEYDYVKGLWSGYEERKLKNLAASETLLVPRHTQWATLNTLDLYPNTKYTIIAEISETSKASISLISGNNDNTHKVNWIIPSSERKGVLCVTTTKPLRMGLWPENDSDIEVKNIIVLEGDWTDNPPTYEEVMANEGKYAVKVKLDNPNATIFGKGGRL